MLFSKLPGYKYFYYRSRGFLGMARLYEAQGNLKDALWCCRVALELQDRASESLIEVSQTTNCHHQARIKLIEEMINQVKEKL